MDIRDTRVWMGMLLLERCVEGAWSDIGLFIFWNMVLLGFYSLFWMMIDVFIIGTPIVTYMQEGVQIIEDTKKWSQDVQEQMGLKPSTPFKVIEMRYYHADGRNVKIQNQSFFNIYTYVELFKTHFGDFQSQSYEEKAQSRIRITYQFQGKEYIMYYRYTDYAIEFPFIKDEDMILYRKDIIKPFYNRDTKRYSLYSLFMMDSRDIYKITLDGEEVSKSMYEYFQKIAGPMNDFGILHKMPVKLKWILQENGLHTECKEGLKVTFLNEYLDEETMELKKQEWESKDVNASFCTDYMKKVLKKKNWEDYGCEFYLL
jgi:hypothetical protein